MQAIMQASADPKKMIDAGLKALLTMLKNNPQMARIIYIDAMLGRCAKVLNIILTISIVNIDW